jgi:double-stranded uracil-DNA glycosylase
LLFVGINPGLWTAATQTHFAHPSNRFYPALRKAGLIDLDIDPAAGLTDAERAICSNEASGSPTWSPGPPPAPASWGRTSSEPAASHLHEVVARLEPRVVAVAGVTAFRVAFGARRATVGRQPESFEGADLWVVPNPSGLNAHETVDSLAEWYRRVGRAAGMVG